MIIALIVFFSILIISFITGVVLTKLDGKNSVDVVSIQNFSNNEDVEILVIFPDFNSS